MLRILDTAIQRSIGAMFRKSLGGDVLVFIYGENLPRLFHTFFCPPLRMIALDADEKPVFDDVIAPFRFVLLPPCRYIIECAPDANIAFVLGEALPAVRRASSENAAAWQTAVGVDRLMFALVAQSLADLRRLYERVDGGSGVDSRMLAQFQPHERGRFVESAALVLDASAGISIPPGALRIARQVLQAEQQHFDELLAAAAAGTPWKARFPSACIRCGENGSWRFVLTAPPQIAPEASWRYLRPENAVPLCRRCAAALRWHKDEDLRRELVWGLWGARFEALLRWHKAASSGTLPADWSRLDYPLWPDSFGGKTWQTGSGAEQYAEPRPPYGIRRTAAQRRALARILGVPRLCHEPDTPARFVLSYNAEGDNL